MKLIDVIIFVSAFCLMIIGIDQALVVGFYGAYWIFMFSLMLLFLFVYRRARQSGKSKKTKKKPKKKR